MEKIIVVDHAKCTGCRLCELVCSVVHHGVSNPEKSRIRIIKWESEGVYVPTVCQQCEDAPCMTACPHKAIFRDADTDAVLIDYSKCIGCRFCVAVCPFGAMVYNSAEKKVFKCDLCGGNPQCVRFCDVKAVSFAPAEKISYDKKRITAEKLHSGKLYAAS